MDVNDSTCADADFAGSLNVKTPYKVNKRGQVRPRIYNLYGAREEHVPQLKKQKTGEVQVPVDISETTLAVEMSAHTEEVDAVNATPHILDADEVEELGDETMEQNFEEQLIQEPQIQDDQYNDMSSVDNSPIYNGHTMTVFTSVILIWVYALTHSITGSQLSDLLVLINAHCLNNIPVYNSLNSFKKYFADLKSPLKRHYYCSVCLMGIKEEADVCPNGQCSIQLTGNNLKSYFIEFPLENQLRDLFRRGSFRSNLKYRFTRSKKRPNGIEDIFDGELYKEMSKPGNPLSDINNISLTWNTDGIPVFKSSKFSLWPLYLMVNELPYKERIKKSNMLFYGLWFGDLKPSINLFCGPLQETLKKFETHGLDLDIENTTVNVKAFLFCGTADLPAKSTALNMNQFNGSYSCSRCFQKGRTEKTGPRGHTHIFPYNADNPTGPERTAASCAVDGIQALRETSTVNGIKGPTFLVGLKMYDFVLSTSIDYMHCVLLGMTKKLMSFWFSVSFSSESFSLVKKLDVVDSRLLNIKPPFHISRRPRSIAEHSNFGKPLSCGLGFYFILFQILVI